MTAGLIKTVLRVSAWLPLSLLQGVAILVARLLDMIPNDLRRITRINLGLCLPELDDAARRRLEQRSLDEAVKTAFELGPVWRWSKRRFSTLIHSVSGEDQLQRELARGHGVILVAPHLGMWEAVGLYVSIHYPITSLYRPSRVPALDAVMTEGRQRFGAQLVPTDASGIRRIYRALARGEVAGLLPDQEPRWGNGVFAPFFGINAYTMTLLPRLAASSGAAVLLAWAERLPGGRGYDVHFQLLDAECFRHGLEQAAQYLNSTIESRVRKLPEQYQWSYRRFRTAPDNQKYDYYLRGQR